MGRPPSVDDQHSLVIPDLGEIMVALSKLAEKVRGNDVMRLTVLTDMAISYSEDNARTVFVNDDFNVADKVAYNAHEQEIISAVKALILAAKEIERLADEDVLSAELTWLASIGHFDGACDQYFKGGEERVADVIRRSAFLVSGLQFNPAPNERRGPKPQRDHIGAVVRAVAVYMTEQGLPFQRSWPADTPMDENKGRRGGKLVAAENLQPPSYTAELIVAALNAFKVPYTMKRVRTRLKEYADLLRGRLPEEKDIFGL